MNRLMTPFTYQNLNLKNRIVMPPMCTYMATDGYADDWHLVHYGTRAMGGAGLIILEATSVLPEGRISDDDLGLWSDDQIIPLKNITAFVKEKGSAIAIQLAHAGRKSGVKNSISVAPSPMAFSTDYNTPKEMTHEDIHKVIHAFKDAARRADEAGFDAIEIHGAHGYLINEFLSPLTNKRTDGYGGDLNNRCRFLLEIIFEVKKVWPSEKVMMVRLSADEYDDSGNQKDDFVSIVNTIKKEDIQIINVSTGGVVQKDVPVYPGYQLKHAEYIKKQTGVMVLAGGLITTAEMADEIIANNRADLVYFGRELLRNPYFPSKAAEVLNEDIKWPKAYERSKLMKR